MISGQKFAQRTQGWTQQVIGYTIQPQGALGYEQFEKVITLIPPVTQDIKGFSATGDPVTHLINCNNFNAAWQLFPMKFGFAVNNQGPYANLSPTEGLVYNIAGFSDAGLTTPVNFVSPDDDPSNIALPDVSIDYTVVVSQTIEQPNLYTECQFKQWTLDHETVMIPMGVPGYMFFPSYMFTPGSGQQDFYLRIGTYTVGASGTKVRNTIVLNIRWFVP